MAAVRALTGDPGRPALSDSMVAAPPVPTPSRGGVPAETPFAGSARGPALGPLWSALSLGGVQACHPEPVRRCSVSVQVQQWEELGGDVIFPVNLVAFPVTMNSVQVNE